MRNLRNFIYSFVFKPALSADEVSSFQHSTEPWESLAYVVHRASFGDFAPMDRIERLLRSSDHALLWGVATKFVGFAGSWTFIEKMAESFRDEPDYLQEFIGSMLMYGGTPAFAARLIELYEAAEDDDVRQGLAWNLSFLLEPERGLIWIGARESDKYGDDLDDEEGEMPDFKNMSFQELFSKKRDYAAYREAVREAQDALLQTGVRAGEAVLEGSVLSARGLALRIAERLSSAADARDRVIEEMVLLSAMTGVDFSEILTRPGGINRLDACALIESLLEDPMLDSMIPGKRYFMGHLISD